METKIIAMYLPQYHEILENDEFWGKGYTDWVSVKKATPLYKGHTQPKVPLNRNYYDLSSVDAIRWQAKLAKEYGVYGFGIYHYWFNSNKKVLERPAEIILHNKDIDIPFCFAWDNTSWIRTWSKMQGNDWTPSNDDGKVTPDKSGVLLKLDYGSERDWEIHFNYLYQFFLDKRYIKKDRKPVFIFYSNTQKDKMVKMVKYWDELARKKGLDGIYIITRSTPFNKNKLFDGVLRYEPVYSGWQKQQIINSILKINKVKNEKKYPDIFLYDNVWNKIIRNAKTCRDKDVFYGGFVGYDDTPRRGYKGKVIEGNTPEKFSLYLHELLNIAQKQSKEYIFLTAWNEWGEGAYLEPDEINRDSYLKQIIGKK